MTTHKALLIEDDVEQLEWMVPRIEQRGFSVLVASADLEARRLMSDAANEFDLIVVDRRIPHSLGGVPIDALGDELRVALFKRYPAARIMVFTAFPDVDQVQEISESSGHIQIRDREINRVSLFTKRKFIDFEDAVCDFSNLLNEIDDIEIVVLTGHYPSDAQLRCIRRAAVEFKATSVEVQALMGGLTGTGVWRCNLRGEFASTGAVVVKASKRRPKIGGIANVLPVGTVASVNGVFEGLCHGMYVMVMQDVGDGVSFSEAYTSDSNEALASLSRLMQHLATVQSAERVITLSDLVHPYCTWDEIALHMQKNGIVPLSSGARLTAKIGARHGDLHLENILVTSTNAVLIDCDEPVQGALAVDIVGMLLSTLTHPESPIRSDAWPSSSDIRASFGKSTFGAGHAWFEFFSACDTFRASIDGGSKEFWGLVLAFSVRQFRYSDVTGDAAVVERLEALIGTAVDHIRND